MSNVSEPTWQRQLLIGIVALLAVGVIIGGIVAVLAVKAADVTLNGSGPGHHGPILPNTAGTQTSTNQTTPTTPTQSSPTQPTPTKSTAHRRPKQALNLTASPHRVPAMGRINLTGSYPGHDGATLQVQRAFKGGSWQDFPVTVTVHGDTFATYVETGYSGVNHFRVVDKADNKTSNSVLVVVK